MIAVLSWLKTKVAALLTVAVGLVALLLRARASGRRSERNKHESAALAARVARKQRQEELQQRADDAIALQDQKDSASFRSGRRNHLEEDTW